MRHLHKSNQIFFCNWFLKKYHCLQSDMFFQARIEESMTGDQGDQFSPIINLMYVFNLLNLFPSLVILLFRKFLGKPWPPPSPIRYGPVFPKKF